MTDRDVLVLRRLIDREMERLDEELHDLRTPSKHWLKVEREKRELRELKDNLMEEAA